MPVGELGIFLKGHLHDGGPLFGTAGDRVLVAQVRCLSPAYSLALVAPERVTLQKIQRPGGGPQLRAKFYWGEHEYDLAVTDPYCEARVRRLGYGKYPAGILGFAEDAHLYLTISLSEPLNDHCFKLVAAIFSLPRGSIAR
jgi:hypothetical protein